jgi:dCMP deaminase
MRPDRDTYYLNIALAVSKRSTCLKRHYGCVIVNNDVIIATGYNGSPRGEENCCERGSCKRADAERYSGYEKCDSVHAEQNALIVASHDRLIGATVYLACEEFKLDENRSAMWEEDIYDFCEDDNPVPCSLCTRMLKNSGVSKIINRRGEVKCL